MTDDVVEVIAEHLCGVETGTSVFEHNQPIQILLRAKAKLLIQALAASGYVVEKGWEEIETAPKDGSEFLAIDRFQDMGVMQYDEYDEIFYTPEDEHILGCTDPTYWKPLPEAPKGA